jgi:hypothetical protein
MSKTIISIENILTLSPMGCIKDRPLVFSSKVDKFPLCKGNTGDSRLTATGIPLTPFGKGETLNSF